MASKINKDSPFLTYCPSSTNNLNKVEGMGAVITKGSEVSAAFFFIKKNTYYYCILYILKKI